MLKRRKIVVWKYGDWKNNRATTGRMIVEHHGKPDNDKEIINQAVVLMRKGAKGQDQAALLIWRNMGTRLERFFKYQGVHPDDAEELANDAVARFVNGNPDHSHEKSAIGYFWATARHVMLDRIAHDKALKRQNKYNAALTDEDFEKIEDPTSQDIAEINARRDCMERAHGLLQLERPVLIPMLTMISEELSMQEIADALSIKLAAAKQRVKYARDVFFEYFKECKE
jgi:DNA-directed RNA polymerase specialized sigma24 family protein